MVSSLDHWLQVDILIRSLTIQNRHNCKQDRLSTIAGVVAFLVRSGQQGCSASIKRIMTTRSTGPSRLLSLWTQSTWTQENCAANSSQHSTQSINHGIFCRWSTPPKCQCNPPTHTKICSLYIIFINSLFILALTPKQLPILCYTFLIFHRLFGDCKWYFRNLAVDTSQHKFIV